MPVLHKYKEKDEHYVLTSIKGNIVTFQLTAEGQKKLILGKHRCQVYTLDMAS